MKPSKLRARWWREQYEPTWLGLLINPFYFARRGLRRELGPLLAPLTGDVLDVGCGCQPYRALMPAARYRGLDVDNPFTRAVGVADLFYDGTTFPVPAASCDGILCSQVLEHVFTPEAFLQEIHRVLRPGGCLVLTVPLAWDEHEQPHDFARYTSFGLRALLERNGFEVTVQHKSVAGPLAVVQLASGCLYKLVVTRSKWCNLVTQVALIAPVNLLGGFVALLLPRQGDFYLDNVVLARKRAERPPS
ncbi:MAG: class I SAM-dependent methyltransferase [Verrucomicrobia bacterium]|nr:class I SAM-dependent methyltransferase [Verrucomicrobiota bacterium]